MGLLTDLLEGYATGVSHRTGLHYVPSFNDLNTGGSESTPCTTRCVCAGSSEGQREPTPLNFGEVLVIWYQIDHHM